MTAVEKVPAKGESAPQYSRLWGDPRRKTLGFKIVNLKALQTNGKGLVADPPWKEGANILDPIGGPWRIPDFLEPPRIVYNVKFKHAPRDSEGGHIAWIVSEKLKAIVEQLAPDGSAFRACETVWSNGEPGPERWICSIVQVFSGVVDLSLSENLSPWTLPSGRITYSETSLSKIVIQNELLGNTHLFRVLELNHRDTYCDEIFHHECKKMNITGLRFKTILSK